MEEQHRIGYEVKAVSNLLKRKVFEMNAADHETLTEMQMHIISFLYEHRGEDVFQRDLEEAFSVRRSSVSRFLATMERQGLLMRQPVSEDARLKKLSLTPEGVAKHEQGVRRIDKLEEAVTHGLTLEEQKEFLRLIQKIKRNLS